MTFCIIILSTKMSVNEFWITKKMNKIILER